MAKYCCFGICCNPTVSDDAHEHPLELRTNNTTLYRCAGCKEIGYGSFYQCVRSCSTNFKLHEECTNLSSGYSTTHSLFFKNVRFIFQKQPPETVGSCVACGMSVQGFRYHEYRPKKNAFVKLFVPTKELVLHPRCFSLPINKTNPGVINLELKENAPSKCLICQRKKISKKIKGWAYVSTCGEYCYHVKCMKDPVHKIFESFDQQSDGSLRLEVTHKVVEQVVKDVTLVLLLIIQAIFGDPFSAIVTFALHFFNKRRNFLGPKKLTEG